MTAQPDAAGDPAVVATDAGPLRAVRAGAGHGRTALLLPGYTGSKEDFAPLLGPAAAAGLEVVAVDLPGQFESPGPAEPAAYAPDRLAAVVAEVAAALDPPVHLLGHSFGGLVARAAVIARPELFRSLVLMSSGPAAIGGARREMIERLRPLLAESGLAAVYAAAQAAARAQPGYSEPPAPLAQFLERRFLAGAPAMLEGMGEALRTEPDRVSELAAVRAPTLVLYGADDDAWPPAVQDEMAHRLGAERAVVPGAAHSPAVENPGPTLAALLGFWNRVDGR